MGSPQDEMWTRCRLLGAELDAAVASVYKIPHRLAPMPGQEGQSLVVCMELLKPPYDVKRGPYNPSTNWAIGGPLIDLEQIFLQPPHHEHRVGGRNAGWFQIREWRAWRATVSQRVDDKGMPTEREIFGRGQGPTPLIAAMRAIVDSRRVWGQTPPAVSTNPSLI